MPPGRVGLNARLLKVDLQTGATTEYVYVVDAINQGRGVNDLLAIDDHEFLVVERDNRSLVPTPPNAAQTPNIKRIYKINLAGATDVSNVASLPATGAALLGAGHHASDEDAVHRHARSVLRRRCEHQRRRRRSRTSSRRRSRGWRGDPICPTAVTCSYVISDNDLFPGRPTQIYAFAIDAAADINMVPQQLSGPMFPPGQVKKASQ